MRSPRLRLAALASSGLLACACGGTSPPVKSSSVSGTGSEKEAPSGWGAPVSEQASAPAERLPEVVARAELRPLVTSIKPGRPFWMGLHLSIHEGYRVSWTYPGDLGREIRVRFSAPEGFGVGRVVYPAPSRFRVGEHEAFGWEGETAAFVRITPPARLSAGDAYRIDVDADWLACKRECLRETTKAYVELSASRSGGGSSGDEALEALLARVPKPFGEETAASHEWMPDGRRPSVALAIDGVRLLEFIPATDGSRNGVTAKVLEGGSVLSLEYEDPPGPPPHTTYGVLLGKRGEELASYEVEIPWIDVERGAETK